MSVFDLIKKDHDNMRSLMSQIKDVQSFNNKKSIFRQIKDELWAHNKIEERVFYEYLKGSEKTWFNSMESINEHHFLNSIVEELDTIDVSSRKWDVKFKVFDELLDHHMDEEEDEIFKNAREVIGSEKSIELGNSFSYRKELVLRALR